MLILEILAGPTSPYRVSALQLNDSAYRPPDIKLDNFCQFRDGSRNICWFKAKRLVPKQCIVVQSESDATMEKLQETLGEIWKGPSQDHQSSSKDYFAGEWNFLCG